MSVPFSICNIMMTFDIYTQMIDLKWEANELLSNQSKSNSRSLGILRIDISTTV